MSDLYTKIEDGEYSIEIKETRRGRFPALNKGGVRTLTKEEDDELQEMMKKYKDTILSLYDINEEYSGNKRAWKLGKEIASVQKDDQADIQALFKILPVERFSDSSAYRYRLFYEAFPDSEGETHTEYNPEHRHTILSELVQRSEPTETKSKYEVARDIYDRIRHQDDLSQDEVRAWSDISNGDPQLTEVVAAVRDRVDQPAVENVINIYQMLDEEPPSEDRIEQELK